ncbi:ferritin-like domain-containing protein, partial [Pseudomonas proteolytica]|uniref:ferritin-like domain-containing protein n=1 Tax=Pseudomonas proteolytica TaxID=219574 RepID=UPI0030D727C5
EIANEKAAQVAFLRTTLGTAVVAQPAIDLGSTATSAFSVAMRAAGIVASGVAFDPFASDENFLLAAFMLEDVVVTAYTGRQSTIATTLLIDAAAGIHATTSYHAGLIRTVLYAKGSVSTPSLLTNAGLISNARDAFDGSTDLDQGIVGDSVTSNISPLD